MPNRPIPQTIIGGMLTLFYFLDKYFGWLRAFDWLHKNHPDAWGFLVDPITQNSLMFFGVVLLGYSGYAWYKFKVPPPSPPAPPASVQGLTNITSGPQSPIAGRDVY